MITIHISWSIILFIICATLCFFTSGVFFVIALTGALVPVLKYIHDFIMYCMVAWPTNEKTEKIHGRE